MSVVHENDENAMCWGIMDYFMSALLCISIQIIRSFVHFFSRLLLLVGMFSVLGDVLVPRLNIKAKSDGIFGTKYYTFPFSNGQRAFIKIKRQKVNIARQSLRSKHWEKFVVLSCFSFRLGFAFFSWPMKSNEILFAFSSVLV